MILILAGLLLAIVAFALPGIIFGQIVRIIVTRITGRP